MNEEKTKGTITVSTGNGSEFYCEGDAATAAHLNSLPDEKGAWFTYHPPKEEDKPLSKEEIMRQGIG